MSASSRPMLAMKSTSGWSTWIPAVCTFVGGARAAMSSAPSCRFRKGDIIFGRRRAYQRKLAVAELDGICSAHAMVVRAKPDVVLPEFLPFLMMSDRFMNRAVEISVGSLSPTINWTTLKLEEFDLPPLDQQRRIAEILWAVDEALEQMRILELNALRFETLEVRKAVRTRIASQLGLGDLR